MKLLAYHCCPGVPGGAYREYAAEELRDPEKLARVFDYCQILDAYITADGWYFLIAHYGFEKLYEIDRKSGWFDEDTLAEYIERVCGQIQMLEELRRKDAEEYDTLELESTKEKIADIKAYAQSKGMSPQALIRMALDEFRHTRGELHTPRYLLTFCPDKGYFFSWSCAAEERFGYRVPPEKLPLSPETAAEVRALYADYIALKSPEHPSDRPRLTPEQFAALNARANTLFVQASQELGADYQIQKQDAWF